MESWRLRSAPLLEHKMYNSVGDGAYLDAPHSDSSYGSDLTALWSHDEVGGPLNMEESWIGPT